MSQIVAASPHVTTKNSTAVIMRDVLIALLPAVLAGCVVFGLRALLVVAVTTAACVFFEWGFEKLCHTPSTISDLSAAVTGVLLAMNLPVSIPLWQAVFGALVAMVAVKGLFGGLGKNFAKATTFWVGCICPAIMIRKSLPASRKPQRRSARIPTCWWSPASAAAIWAHALWWRPSRACTTTRSKLA